MLWRALVVFSSYSLHFGFIELLGYVGLIILIKFGKISTIISSILAPHPSCVLSFQAATVLFLGCWKLSYTHWCCFFFFFPLCVLCGIILIAISSSLLVFSSAMFNMLFLLSSVFFKCQRLWFFTSVKFIWVFKKHIVHISSCSIFPLLNICTIIMIVLCPCLLILFASFLHLLIMGHIFLFLFLPANFLLAPDLMNFNMLATGYFTFLTIFSSSFLGFSEVIWKTFDHSEIAFKLCWVGWEQFSS